MKYNGQLIIIYSGIKIAVRHWTMSGKICYMSGIHASIMDILCTQHH